MNKVICPVHLIPAESPAYCWLCLVEDKEHPMRSIQQIMAAKIGDQRNL